MTAVRPAGPAPGDPAEIQRILFGFAGGLAWDVGGNWGDVAERLTQSFERVISFEPAEESYRLLLDAASRTRGLDAVHMAISDHDGEVLLDVQEHSIRTGQLTTASPGDTPGSLSEKTWGRVLERRTVPCQRLDSLDEWYGTPDFIKIDVEGHEVAVIEGGLSLLDAARPQLFVEIHDAALGTRIRELLHPIYKDHLRVVRHPHYEPQAWGYANHYYLLAGEGAVALLDPPKPAVPERRRDAVTTRDIEADYRRALVEERAAYLRAGRTADAAVVSAVLRDRYGLDVEEAPKKREQPVQETAEAEPAPETVVDPKPRRGGRPKLPRDKDGNIIRGNAE